MKFVSSLSRMLLAVLIIFSSVTPALAVSAEESQDEQAVQAEQEATQLSPLLYEDDFEGGLEGWTLNFTLEI
ncbi:hypothetical protein AB6A23_06645 [Paenibacillus tarimensis]